MDEDEGEEYQLLERAAYEPTERDIAEAAWTIVRRENIELRTSHPRAYRWARAWIDDQKTRRGH